GPRAARRRARARRLDPRARATPGRVRVRCRRAVVGGGHAQGWELRPGGADAGRSLDELAGSAPEASTINAIAHEHAHAHGHVHVSRDADRRARGLALALILAFMVVEVVAGILASSLALLSDAGHMLTDAAAMAISLAAARLATRPAYGAMTYGLGRVEILSAQANGLTLLVLAGLIVYGAIVHLVAPSSVHGGVVVAVALAGILVNLLAARILAGGGDARERSLNVEGSYRHILTDLYGFIATAVAGAVILVTGFDRADAIASLLIAGLMVHAAYSLLKASGRIFLE